MGPGREPRFQPNPRGSIPRYKVALAVGPPSERIEALKDLTGLGNGGGGSLIYGVEEDPANEGIPIGLQPLTDRGLVGVLDDVTRSSARPPLLLISGFWRDPEDSCWWWKSANGVRPLAGIESPPEAAPRPISESPMRAHAIRHQGVGPIPRSQRKELGNAFDERSQGPGRCSCRARGRARHGRGAALRIRPVGPLDAERTTSGRALDPSG
jgi:hypothetical protein